MPLSIPFLHTRGAPGAQFVTVVSGLPRSGTSMVMKMLEAGGVPVLTDDLRRPDESNPRGYYEFERVKKLREGDHAWLPSARGKAVKVVSALVEYLPDAYAYKVIFVQRNLAEILASQRQMLSALGATRDTVSDEKLAGLFQEHLARVEAWLARRPNMQVLFVNYNQILADPLEQLERIRQFLGLPLDTRGMAQIIDPGLYRQRRQAS
jgi:hypothetical protein